MEAVTKSLRDGNGVDPAPGQEYEGKHHLNQSSSEKKEERKRTTKEVEIK